MDIVITVIVLVAFIVGIFLVATRDRDDSPTSGSGGSIRPRDGDLPNQN